MCPGIGLTCFAFISAYRAIRRGDSHQANRMFRARVAAQGFTIIAMVAGSMYYSKDRAKTKELRKLNEEHDAELKRQKWIRELEVRDEEDKAMVARIKKRAGEKSKAEEDPAAAAANGSGILSRMGLWSQGEAAAAAAADDKTAPSPASAKEEADKKTKKNPRSSLGAIGEVMSSQKKDDESSKK